MKNIDWSKNSGKVKSQHTDIIVALDVGTSKIAAVVAEVNDDGQYEVIGLGSSASQ
jgi:cell division protein FtsA